MVAKRGFRQLLAELDVNEFSRYEKVAPKMEADARCVLCAHAVTPCSIPPIPPSTSFDHSYSSTRLYGRL